MRLKEKQMAKEQRSVIIARGLKEKPEV